MIGQDLEQMMEDHERATQYLYELTLKLYQILLKYFSIYYWVTYRFSAGHRK